ncbi:hypothetical protein ACTUSR_11175 [Pantoea stewartii subsp. indologenes]|uniref:hypothetical protein n=1 Tax=Pantoea stewartii TaxID=66269 RepID=UPI003FA40C50
MSEYLYHVTGNAIATVQIRQQGLVPASQRTGRNEASSSGSFAVNKASQYQKKIESVLCNVLFKVSQKGFSADELFNRKFNFSIQGVDTKMNRDDAMSKLTDEENRLVDTVIGKPTTPSSVKLSGIKIKDIVPKYLVSHRNSDIYRYAEEYTTKIYDIEENITSNNIYFVQKDYGPLALKDYGKYHGGISNCRVLRVKKSDVDGLKQDPSDHRAMMTNFKILPHLIEIYDLGSNPFDGAVEDNEGRWKKLA